MEMPNPESGAGHTRAAAQGRDQETDTLTDWTSIDHRRRGDRLRRRLIDLVSGAATAPAGAGQGGCDAVRHYSAG